MGLTELSAESIAKFRKAMGEDGFGGFIECPMPGHTGTDSKLVEREGRLWSLLCRCREPQEVSLARLWAARAYGDNRFISNTELRIWWRRLAHDVGELQPTEVATPPLSADAMPAAHKLRAGFELLCGLRDDFPHKAVPYSCRFAAGWCGVSVRDAMLGLRELRKHGVIAEVGRAHRSSLYLPGIPDAPDFEDARAPADREPVAVRRSVG